MNLASASSKSDGHSTSTHDSNSDFWPLLRTPCLDRDGGQSAFSTSPFPSLTWIVMYSCFSKCLPSLVLSTCLLLLRYLCRLPGRWILFILIDAWNATAVDCNRCATAGNIIWHFSGVDNDDFVTILIKRVTCYAMPSALVCAKNLC